MDSGTAKVAVVVVIIVVAGGRGSVNGTCSGSGGDIGSADVWTAVLLRLQ